ncbi:MAG: hypothetical protein Q9224_006095 [Gallowayella concinna]
MDRYMNTTSQLDAGVRLLTAQVHDNNGTWHLCHTDCSLLDAGTLTIWLVTIKKWLDRNSNEVVTILLVNYDHATASDLDDEFEAAAIKSYAYAPASTDAAPRSWPTLNDLISEGKRLVTFVADLAPSTTTPYLLDEFTFVFENPYSVTSLSNFSCTVQRPEVFQGQSSVAVQSGRLPLMNHILDIQGSFDIQIPDVGNLSVTNAVSGPVGNLGDAAAACTAVYGKAPTFILVDFFEQGSSISTVDRLNGIDPLGRTAAPRNASAHGANSSEPVAQVGNISTSLSCLHGLILVIVAMSVIVITT